MLCGTGACFLLCEGKPAMIATLDSLTGDVSTTTLIWKKTTTGY